MQSVMPRIRARDASEAGRSLGLVRRYGGPGPPCFDATDISGYEANGFGLKCLLNVAGTGPTLSRVHLPTVESCPPTQHTVPVRRFGVSTSVDLQCRITCSASRQRKGQSIMIKRPVQFLVLS